MTQLEPPTTMYEFAPRDIAFGETTNPRISYSIKSSSIDSSSREEEKETKISKRAFGKRGAFFAVRANFLIRFSSFLVEEA